MTGATGEAVYAVNNLSQVKYRVFNDPPPRTVANLNTLANWNADQFLGSAEADNEETHLSGGSNGVLLSYLSNFSASDARVGLRSFNSTTDLFGAPTYIDGPSGIDNNGVDFPHHAQDPSGRIHAVWRSLHDGGRLRYVRSDGGVAAFSAPANLALGESFQDPLVEAGTAGTGFAAWRSGSTIRVVAIDPQPDRAGPGPAADRVGVWSSRSKLSRAAHRDRCCGQRLERGDGDLPRDQEAAAPPPEALTGTIRGCPSAPRSR